MNRDKYLENIEIKNRRLLLKIYKKHIEMLKIKIFEATEKGNSTVYLENLRLQVEKQIAQFEKDLKQYSASAVKTSYESGAKTAVVGELAKEIAGDYVFGTANNEAMRTLAQTTYEPLSKMAQQIGRATREYMKRENFQDTQTVLKALGKFVDSNYLRKVGIEGVCNVVVGSETWQTAARKIRDKIISEANIKVPYYNKKGDVIRFVHAQDYAKMVSRTTTANVFREGAKDRILDTFGDDGDLVEIIGKSIFPDSPCIPYQGKILSLEGQTKGYTTIKEAKANGLFHCNCVHNFGVTDKVMEIYGYDVGNEKPEKSSSENPNNSKEETKAKNNAVVKENLTVQNAKKALEKHAYKIDLPNIHNAENLFIVDKTLSKLKKKYPLKDKYLYDIKERVDKDSLMASAGVNTLSLNPQFINNPKSSFDNAVVNFVANKKEQLERDEKWLSYWQKMGIAKEIKKYKSKVKLDKELLTT